MVNSENGFISFFSIKKNFYSVIIIIFLIGSVYLFNVYYGRLNNRITTIETGVHITNLSEDKELLITYEQNGEGLKVYNLFYHSLLVKYPDIIVVSDLLYDNKTNKLWLGYWEDLSVNEKRLVINYLNVNDFRFVTNNYVSQSLEFKDKSISIDTGDVSERRYMINDPDYNYLVVFSFTNIIILNLLDLSKKTLFCYNCFNFFPNHSPLVWIDGILFWAKESVLYSLRITPNSVNQETPVLDFGGNATNQIKFLASNGNELLIFLSNLDVYSYQINDNTTNLLINVNSINYNISDWELSNKYAYTSETKNVVLVDHHSDFGLDFISGFSWEVDFLQNLKWTAVNIVYPSNNPIPINEDFLQSDNSFKMQTNDIIFSKNQKIYSFDLESLIIVEQTNYLFVRIPPFTDWLLVGLSLSLIIISIFELRSRIIKKKN